MYNLPCKCKTESDIYWFISRIQIQQLIMLYHKKDNNQHIYYQEAHDPIHINESNIYNISHAYRKLSTHLTQNQTVVKSKYRKKSY